MKTFVDHKELMIKSSLIEVGDLIHIQLWDEILFIVRISPIGVGFYTLKSRAFPQYEGNVEWNTHEVYSE